MQVPKLALPPKEKTHHPPFNHPTQSDRSWQPPIRGGPRSPRRSSVQWQSPISASAIFGTQVGFYNGLPDPQEKYDLLKRQENTLHPQENDVEATKKHPTPTWRFEQIAIWYTSRSWLRGLFAGKTLCKFHNEATASGVLEWGAGVKDQDTNKVYLAMKVKIGLEMMKCETVVKVGRFEWHCMFGSGSCVLYAECIVGVESEVLEDFDLLEFRLQLVPWCFVWFIC